MKIIRHFFTAIILLLTISFSALNAELITVNVYFHVYHLPLSLLIIVIFGLGILVGYLRGRFRRFPFKSHSCEYTRLN